MRYDFRGCWYQAKERMTSLWFRHGYACKHVSTHTSQPCDQTHWQERVAIWRQGCRAWGRGQRVAILSGRLPKGLNHLQPPWRKCSVTPESRTQDDRQKERQIYRKEGTFRKLGKEQRTKKIRDQCRDDTISQPSSALSARPTRLPRILLSWHKFRELMSSPWWESLHLCQSAMMLIKIPNTFLLNTD